MVQLTCSNGCSLGYYVCPNTLVWGLMYTTWCLLLCCTCSDLDIVPSKRRKKPTSGGSGGGSRRSSGRGGSDVLRAAMEAGIGQLMDMGFSRSKARDALQEFDCDVEAAVEYLMQACM